MYASLLGISGALHLDIFDQPVQQVFLGDLLMKLFPLRRLPYALCLFLLLL